MQFEAEVRAGEARIVRDSKVHVEVIKNVIGYASDNSYTHGLDYSPVKELRVILNIYYTLETRSSKEIS